MSPISCSFIGIAVLAFVSAAPHIALAQGSDSPPPQGLFGSSRSAEAPTQLDVTLSLIEGYDSDVPAEFVPRFDRGNLQTGGFSTMFSAAARYGRRGPRVQVGANAASMLRHYAELGETKSVGHSAGVGLIAQVSRNASVLLNQAASYSPAYFYGLFPGAGEIEPGDAASTQPDFAVSQFDAYSHVSTATLRHASGMRSNITVGGDFRYTDRLEETDDWRDVTGHAFRAGYSTSPTRNTGLTTTARYRSGEFSYAGDGKSTEIAFDVDWSYNRRLSATRAVNFGVSLGVSGADVSQAPAGMEILRRRYRATGSGRLEYPLGRTWRVSGDFRRGLDYVNDLPTPVYSTGTRVGVGGLVMERIDVSASAGYSRGASALNRSALQFDTYTGNLRVRYALSAQVATYAEYLYYYYDFRGEAELPEGIPASLERNGVRVGLTLWVPAVRR